MYLSNNRTKSVIKLLVVATTLMSGVVSAADIMCDSSATSCSGFDQKICGSAAYQTTPTSDLWQTCHWNNTDSACENTTDATIRSSECTATTTSTQQPGTGNNQ
jgi:hypothetical protein